MKFEPGKIFVYDGIEYRTILGRLGPQDMLHQFRMLGSNHWHTPKIAHQLITVSQKYQTEEINYPRERGFEGGGRLLRYIRDACENGWEAVAAKIDEESKLAWTRRY